MKLKDKALLLIEAYVSDDISQNLEYDVMLKRETNPKLISIQRKISAIYHFSHIARKPSCISSHDDWIKELNSTYKRFKKHGVI